MFMSKCAPRMNDECFSRTLMRVHAVLDAKSLHNNSDIRMDQCYAH